MTSLKSTASAHAGLRLEASPASRDGSTVLKMASLKGRSGFAQLDAVVIAGREDPTTAVGRLASGPEVDIVYDAVGKDTFGQSVACLAPGGHLVSFGQASVDVGAHSINSLANQSATVSRPNYPVRPPRPSTNEIGCAPRKGPGRRPWRDWLCGGSLL
jgi:hypothetical protein